MVPLPLAEVLALAAEFERGGRLGEAARLVEHAAAVAPEAPDVLHLRAILAFRDKRLPEALVLMERAALGNPLAPLIARNLCELYRVCGRLDDALAAGQRAVELGPGDAMAHHHLALVHYERLEIAAATAWARQAIAVEPAMPGAHFELAECLLVQGEFAAGWEEYEWRFRVAGAPALMPATDRPQWDGAALDPAGAGLLLIADQGFGDVIQFARYIPWVRRRCPNVAIACSIEVDSLLRQIAPDVPIFQAWEKAPPFAAFCPLSGLPRLHGTRGDNVPADVPYLRPDPARLAQWRGRLDALVPPGYRRLAIAWAGRPSHTNDRNRSTSLARFAPLAAVPGVALISVQKGEAAAQAGGYFGRAPLVNLGAEIGDFDDTMAILALCERLVSVDTALVHLAGAMNHPTTVLLPRAPDWRWLLGRGDTPWYPSVSLLRQDARRSYEVLIAELAERLIPATGMTGLSAP